MLINGFGAERQETIPGALQLYRTCSKALLY